ncbi:glycosyltransferase family protein [Paracoccus mutanolyticus]|uniref:hypothetical protein n=1 Tax=Paracoccus mutanolyticus TaxID=1499308 RepID=UPI0021D52936|nr:hypothetical protein [Paracoccus mutanolyticus]
MILAEARLADQADRGRWRRILDRGLMGRVQHVLAPDQTAATTARQLGADPARIEVTGPVTEPCRPCPRTRPSARPWPRSCAAATSGLPPAPPCPRPRPRLPRIRRRCTTTTARCWCWRAFRPRPSPRSRPRSRRSAWPPSCGPRTTTPRPTTRC